MGWFRGFGAGFSLVIALAVAMRAGAAPQYQFVDLFPNGSKLDTNGSAMGAYIGPSGPQQVGYNKLVSGYLWSGSAASAVTLGPQAPYFGTEAHGGYATPSGGEQVGQAQGLDGFHAALWRGTADSFVDLGKGNALSGYAVPGGSRQVGYNNFSHAMLWSGSAASAIDLNPAGYDGSVATGGYYSAATGEQQLGYGHSLSLTANETHAFLWSGTAASAVDLHPTGLGQTFAESEVDGGAATANGAWQVGYATGAQIRAVLWSGSAASAVDLTPPGLPWAEAHATNGTMIVGEGGQFPGATGDALLWTSADPTSVVDLQQYLPPQYTNSVALGIDAEGDIVGRAAVGFAGPQQTGYYTAVAWVVVPEPASLTWLVLAGAFLARRRER